MEGNSTFSAASESAGNSFKKRILIVDDVELICRVLKNQLAAAGYQGVESESDSRLVMERIKEFKPDLILLDIFMPHLSGLEILKSIRANSELDEVIVLMLSCAGADEQYQSLELGAFGFIQKPVTAETLVQTITSKFAIASRLGIQ